MKDHTSNEARVLQKSELVVENVCPSCHGTACVQFLTIDGKEVHINCIECNRVYAARIPPAKVRSGDLEITRWREIGSFVRL